MQYIDTKIKGWIEGVPLEDQALQQLRNTASLPFIFKHIAVMPDVHWGMGSTVGSVVPTKGAIIPAAVGVDIGCGMVAQRLSLRADQLPDNLSALRTEIERLVPHGRTNNGGEGDRGAWHNPPFAYDQLPDCLTLEKLIDKHPKIEKAAMRAVKHLGTLGTGNHFIEICLDETDQVWIMLHSGSRGIGNAIGQYFINLAKEDMRRWFINLPDQDLAYFPEGSTLFNDYWMAVDWAQRFAAENRKMMLIAVHSALRSIFNTSQSFESSEVAINCHHNYVAREHHYGENILVTRKGAVRAREGDLGIIPGSMGTRSYIVRGKGNRESFTSCSHGAGRIMSRTQAKKTFTLEDHALATSGIECRKDIDVIDETPGAYKDVDKVMAAQSDLVEIVHTLRQVLVVKG